MTLIALILVLVVIQPPGNGNGSCPMQKPVPMDSESTKPAFRYAGKQRYYSGEGKRHIYYDSE